MQKNPETLIEKLKIMKFQQYKKMNPKKGEYQQASSRKSLSFIEARIKALFFEIR